MSLEDRAGRAFVRGNRRRAPALGVLRASLQPPPRRWGEDPHLLVGLVAVSILLAAWTFPAWGHAVRIVCPLRILTGLPCPACGATRAVVAASRGDWMTALSLNPLAAVGTAGLFVYPPWALGAFVGGWRWPFSGARARGYQRAIARLSAALVLVNWVLIVLLDAV